MILTNIIPHQISLVRLKSIKHKKGLYRSHTADMHLLQLLKEF